MSLNRPNNRSNQGTWSGLCTPAKLYGAFSVVSVAGLLYNQQATEAVWQVLFSIIWIFVLNWICSEGWTGLSWFLVMMPIILIVIGGFVLAGAMIAAESGMAHQ
jgi:hypothetical protein